MIVHQPLARIALAEEIVLGFREDAASLTPNIAAARVDCARLEAVVARGNRVFGELMGLDSEVQRAVLSGECEFSPETDERVLQLVMEWVSVVRALGPGIDRCEPQDGSVAGVAELKANLREAEGILTPDDAFFGGDALAKLRDRAIEDHGAGLTEPLVGHEPAH